MGDPGACAVLHAAASAISEVARSGLGMQWFLIALVSCNGRWQLPGFGIGAW
jgi:hypothetical protein